MSQKPEGGYAFPKAALDPWGKMMTVEKGMTLRDYFAAKAMQGLMANDAFLARCKADGDKELISQDTMVATGAYLIADAMLAERAKGGAA